MRTSAAENLRDPNANDSKPPMRSLRTLAAEKLRDPIMRELALASEIDIDAIIKRAEVVPNNVRVSGRVSNPAISFFFTYTEGGMLSIKSLDDSKFWFELNTEQLGDSKGFLCSHEKSLTIGGIECDTCTYLKRNGLDFPNCPNCVHCLTHSGYKLADLNDMTKEILKSFEEDEKEGLCHLLRDGDCALSIVSSFEDGGTSYRIDCLQHLNVWLEIIVIE